MEVRYIKNSITSKFKEKLWENEEFVGKMKVKYYMEVINLNLENKNYLYIFFFCKSIIFFMVPKVGTSEEKCK